MKLKDIQINGFGKLENKNIKFEDGLNLVIGSNESGKSTLMGFIKAIFYGINKNKAGNIFSEVEKYKPWQESEFSGKAEYEFGGDVYTVYRDFNKNNTKIYNATGIDITKDFAKDKSRGVLIGNEQFDVDEETFENTAFITQKNIDVDINSQKSIIQKLTNMIQSGDENISYENVTKKLEKILFDEVGTDRTQSKPKNIVNRDLSLKKLQREQLLHKRERQESIESEIKKIENKLEEVSEEIDSMNEVCAIKEKYQTLLQEKRNIYEAEQKVIAKQLMENEKKEKLAKKKVNIIMAVITLAIVALTIIFKKYFILVSLIPIIVLFAINNMKKEKVLQTNVDTNQFDLVIEDLKKKENKELQQLETKGIKKSITERKLTELKALVNGYEKTKTDYILQSHKLDIEKDTLESGVNKLNELEEEIQNLNEKQNQIAEKEASLKLALEVFEESYEELKSKIVPGITLEIQKSVAQTTNGEYTNVKYNGVNGIVIENKFGDIVSIEKLSAGTIDQIYLGFRLAILNRLSNLPIILDEAFAYYDEERLKNIIQTLKNISKEKQVIIFTCSERERKILEELKIEYNLVKM